MDAKARLIPITMTKSDRILVTSYPHRLKAIKAHLQRDEARHVIDTHFRHFKRIYENKR